VLPKQANSLAGKLRLGELLVKAGVVTESQLKTALNEQRQWGGKLGDILVRMRYLSEDVFVRALSKQLAIPRADLSLSIPLEALAKVPAEVAEEYEIVPVALLDDGKTLAIATSDPLNVTVVDYVRSLVQLRVVAHVAGASAIRAAIARLYQSEDLRGDAGDLQLLGNSEDVGPDGARADPASSGAPPTSSPPGPALQNGAPHNDGHGYPPPTYQGIPTPAFDWPGPPAFPSSAPAAAPAANDEAHRREVAALKALVELLVQKGIISLDEYLARLKR
jgi:hypothetical protein